MIITAAQRGAELKSIKKDGVEYLWQGHADIWAGQAPLLFPICGGLKDDMYVFEGKEYIMQKHGFARLADFDVEESSESSATFLLKSSAETLKSYPFEFELRVIYSLTESGVKVTYRVTNVGNKSMYFSIGSHEGYATPEGVEDYDVIFPQKETLSAYMLDGNLLQKNKLPIIKDSDRIALYDKYFLIDALVFKDLKSESATLRNRKTGRFVKIDFPGKPYFLIWHKYGAPYICLEPWCGIQDPQITDHDITKKEGVVALPEGEIYEITHEITVGIEE